jgi:hypothetical protein
MHPPYKYVFFTESENKSYQPYITGNKNTLMARKESHFFPANSFSNQSALLLAKTKKLPRRKEE